MKNLVSYRALLESAKDYIMKMDSGFKTEEINIKDIARTEVYNNRDSEYYKYTLEIIGESITLPDLCDLINSGNLEKRILSGLKEPSLSLRVRMKGDWSIPLGSGNSLELDITFRDNTATSKIIGYPYGPTIDIRFLVTRIEDNGDKVLVNVPLSQSWTKYKQGIKEPSYIDFSDIEETIEEMYISQKMKYSPRVLENDLNNLMTFKSLFENEKSGSIPGRVEPVEFLTNLGFQEQEIEIIAKWMAENRGDINLHYFPFRSSQPIAGVFIGDRDVAINSKMRMPKEMLLFLALHESKHSDQYMAGDFESMYFDPVIAEDRDLFIRGYNELEKEANDYALAAMVDLGFSRFVETQERQLRSNELAGRMVYDMMREDIKKTGATNFEELIRAQVL